MATLPSEDVSTDVAVEQAAISESSQETTPLQKDLPAEFIKDFIAEVQLELDDYTKQINKTVLAERFLKRRLNIGKPGEKARISQLASVQNRAKDLADKYNEQADFIDFLKEMMPEESK